MNVLTPETKIFLEGLQNFNLPPINQTPPQILREQYEAMVAIYGGESLSIEYQDICFNEKIKIRHYKYRNPKSLILYAHGGGWTRGSLNTHHVMCQNLMLATNSELIAIDYSLSPENIYPKAINEIESVYLEKIKQTKIPITIAGDSAGANLMAGLVVRLNAKRIDLPEYGIFFYPSFDLTGKNKSLDEFESGYLLTKNAVNYYVNNYLGNNLDLVNNEEVSPILVMQNISFPKSLIIAAECDPIRDDARIAKEILKKRNLLQGYLEMPGVIHGFAQFPGLFPEAMQSFEWIKNNF